MRIAAIDIGTNSVHMIIAHVAPDRTYDIVDREKDMVKLGAGTFRGGALDQRALDAGVAALRKFKTLIDRHGADVVLAVATSAVREAANGPAFLELVKRETDLRPRVISGIEEARLLHVAVRDVIDLTDRNALVIDIGGGSVELVVGNARSLPLAESVGLGVLRLRDHLGDADPLPRDARKRLDALVREQAGPVIARGRELGFALAVGTSGTILDLGLAAHRARGNDRWMSPDGRVVPVEDLRELADRLASMSADERAAVSGIDAHRADTIHFGALLLVTLLDLAKADSIVLCDVSIREGLVLDHLSNPAATRELRAEPGAQDVRLRSVLALARRAGHLTPHEQRVAQLALQVFDQTQTAHQFAAAERRILECAAWLHDIGRNIDFERHEHHAYYLIRYAGLRGFTEDELELIALAARFHRKAGPKPRHREYAALRPRGRRVVRVLAGILRLAEGLDRGHTQVVRFVRCDLTPQRLRVGVFAEADVELEVWAAQRKSALLARALDREVLVEIGDYRVHPDPTA
ncbi:MAG: HD domain-containing protein [Phycisphaerae bacterium]